MFECDNCHINIATKSQRIIINNVPTVVHLCDECYRAIFNGASIKPSARKANISVCPVCKTSLQEIINSSYLGCPNCYKQFRPAILNNVFAMHNSCTHTGKKIVRSADRENTLADYERILGLMLQAQEEGRLDDAKKYQQFLTDMQGDENAR